MELYPFMVPGGSAESWLLVAITSAASALGSLLIYVDVLWNKISTHKFSILHSDVFLGGALGLSSGTLVTVGLFSLLPSSIAHIVSGRPKIDEKTAFTYVVPLFVLGVFACFLLSAAVHIFASRSVVVCQHDMGMSKCSHKLVRHGDHEHTPLVHTGVHDHGAVHCEENHHTHLSASHSDHAHSGAHSHSHASHHGHGSDAENHMSHSTRQSRRQAVDLLAIGLQTVFGLAIHRLPEGLLLFSTSRADKDLGLSLVVALGIHSFSEGFTMAAPLYGALQNRFLAAATAIILGCGPQVLGAFIGYKFLFKNDDPMSANAEFYFGLSMAATAGFMFVISTQMLGTAFTYISQRCVTLFVVTGALIVLASKAI